MKEDWKFQPVDHHASPHSSVDSGSGLITNESFKDNPESQGLLSKNDDEVLSSSSSSSSSSLSTLKASQTTVNGSEGEELSRQYTKGKHR